MMTDAMTATSKQYVIELESGVWYCGGAIGDPPRTCDVAYASKHEYDRRYVAWRMLELIGSFRMRYWFRLSQSNQRDNFELCGIVDVKGKRE